MDECMNDDFNTARVLAVLFELVPIINSIKDGYIKLQALSGTTITALQTYFKAYLEDIFGLKNEVQSEDGKLSGVLQLLIEIRKDAKLKKDYATSDKIRNQLLALGVVLKDEKDGGVTVSFS
jgi:cysteinyl-tRNA synthetase